MRRWELWRSEDETETRIIPETRPDQIASARQAGFMKLWETEAKGSNDAMRAMYRYLDWGEYKPMLREDGTPYPEDEDDSLAGPDHL